MKSLLASLISLFVSFTGNAQPVHVPNPEAKLINDKAVNIYVKYGTVPDSIISAIRLLNTATIIDSNYLTAWTNKLSFECQLARYDNALTTARKITKIFPAETDMLFFTGVLSLKTGHTDDAADIFNHLIKIYDRAYDTISNDDHLQTNAINKAIALKLLDRDDESRTILINLSMKEHDLAVRRHINSYISKTKEEMISDIISSR